MMMLGKSQSTSEQGSKIDASQSQAKPVVNDPYSSLRKKLISFGV